MESNNKLKWNLWTEFTHLKILTSMLESERQHQQWQNTWHEVRWNADSSQASKVCNTPDLILLTDMEEIIEVMFSNYCRCLRSEDYIFSYKHYAFCFNTFGKCLLSRSQYNNKYLNCSGISKRLLWQFNFDCYVVFVISPNSPGIHILRSELATATLQKYTTWKHSFNLFMWDLHGPTTDF